MTEPSWIRDGESDRTLEENWLFRLRSERYRSRATGRSHEFFVLHLADAVHVVALTTDRQLILVRQFRAGSGRDSLETPGGLLEPGEHVSEAAARELLEETGFAGDPPLVLGAMWSNPSLLSSKTTTVVVTDARRVAGTRLDPGEEVEVVLAPAREIPAMIRRGEIDHALVVAGLLWWLADERPDSEPAPSSLA